jgi:hypothetical protein
MKKPDVDTTKLAEAIREFGERLRESFVAFGEYLRSQRLRCDLGNHEGKPNTYRELKFDGGIRASQECRHCGQHYFWFADMRW